MTKHLVTGSSEFLGSAIVKKLHSKNQAVLSVDIIIAILAFLFFYNRIFYKRSIMKANLKK